MFEEAARKHFNWSCSVGGGSSSIKGYFHGMGCVLDDYHVLTADHCWSEIEDRYEWPVVARKDGLFRCEIGYKSIDLDILVLRSVDKLADCVSSDFNEYPKITESPVFLGSLVGFMSSLKLDESSHTHFAMGVISMMLPSENSQSINFAISSTVIQHGFSGSAIFRPDGNIIGVLIQSLHFVANKNDPNSPWYVLPIVAPIRPLINNINAVLAVGRNAKT